MIAEDAAQQVIAQNLANASTTGYKEDVPVFKSFEENLIASAGEAGPSSGVGVLGSGAQFDTAVTDMSQGPITKTGNPLDIALTGNAFIAVQGPGGTRYSRDGALTLNSTGTLVQSGNGFPVLDDRGSPININTNNASIKIMPDGTINVDGKQAAKLGLYAIAASDHPQKVGDNMLQTAVTPRPINLSVNSTAGVRDGYLEGSNVNIVKEMVTMIAGMRAYEANQKALQQQDEVQNQQVSEVGKIG